jgi:hypothetical protein
MQPSFGSPLRLCSVRTEYLIVTTIASYDEQILKLVKGPGGGDARNPELPRNCARLDASFEGCDGWVRT